ncbi:hypothetical protein LCGC14_0533470 [marine sediment metagenome]|uniref:Uncharacterized protein n=1 Tax=marine sediment metagenome TaxID=412755 RepID=A0A0F9SDD3_9ZZZZ
MIFATYDEEYNLLKRMLLHPAAYHCGIFGMIEIRSLEDGTFAVDSDVIDEEEIFEDVNPAIRRFLDLREEHQIGLDFEEVDIVSETEYFYNVEGKVISFDDATATARAKCGKAIYRFSSTSFRSGRISRFPRKGDEVIVSIGKDSNILILVRLKGT